MVIRDVVTRWNYTHAMIKRALMLRKVCLIIYWISFFFFNLTVVLGC